MKSVFKLNKTAFALFIALLALFSLSSVSATHLNPGTGCCADPNGPNFCAGTISGNQITSCDNYFDRSSCQEVSDCIPQAGTCMSSKDNPTSCRSATKKADCASSEHFENTSISNIGACTSGCCICIPSGTTGTASYQSVGGTASGCAAACSSAGGQLSIFDTSRNNFAACNGFVGTINTNIGQYRGQSATISGTVKDSNTNAVISGAVVQGGGASTSTNQNGQFILTGASVGTYSIFASKVGYDPNSTSISITSSPFTLSNVVVSLGPSSTTVLDGFILNSITNAPIANATVILNTTPTNRITKSNDQGEYTFYGIPQQMINITAQKLLFRENSAIKTIISGLNTQNILLQPLTAPPPPAQGGSPVDVFVYEQVGSSQNALSGATVVLQGSSLPQGGLSAPANNLGHVVFNNIPNGIVYTASATYTANYFPNSASTQTALNGAANLNIALSKRQNYDIEVQVRDPSGSLIQNANVFLETRQETASTGDYTFTNNLEGYPYTLRAAAAGYLPSSPIVVPSLGKNELLTFILSPVSCTVRPSPLVTAVNHVVGKPELIVNYFSACPVDQLYIQRCEDGPDCENPVGFQVNPSSLTFLDGNPEGIPPLPALQPNKKYCYRANATYINPTDSQASQYVCIETGDEPCLNGATEFCQDKDRYTCNATNKVKLRQSCKSTNKVCLAQSSQPPVTACVQESKCAQCNRPYGLFQFSGIYLGNACSNLQFCYLDYTDTAVDKFSECNQVQSCYDYRSKSACQKNNCVKNTPCEWNPVATNQTGTGICRPVDKSKQNGDVCTNKIYNQVFGGCTKDVCEAVAGGYCADPDGDGMCNKCIQKSKISCWDYATESDCNGGNNVSVDVTWASGFGGQLIRVAGSNLVLVNSSDLFGNGLCRYDSSNIPGENCFKDANGDAKQDCGDEDCRHDSKPPTTTLYYSSIQKSFDFDYSVSDNLYKGSDITTWYSITNGNNPCYPGYSAQGGQIRPSAGVQTCEGKDLSEGQQNSAPDGTYFFRYFSEDGAGNLEVVKSVQVTVDRTKPIITITPKKFVEGTTSKTTLQVNISSSELTWCDADLKGTSKQYQKNSELVNGSNPGFSWNDVYNGLDADIYNYHYICHDGAGNTVEDNVLVSVDADATINDPQPSLSAISQTGTIPVSVKTSEPAKCQFGEAPAGSSPGSATSYDTLADSNGGLLHSGTTVANGIQGDMVHKEYDVQCTINSTGQQVQGSDADRIRITIDLKAPSSGLVNASDESQFVSIPLWINSNRYRFKIKCDDSDSSITYTPADIGCGGIAYCSSSLGGTCTPATVTTADIYQPPITASSTIRYYSVDKLGNIESTKTASILVDNVPPGIFNIQPTNGFKTADLSILVSGSMSDAESSVDYAAIEVNGIAQQINISGINPYTFSTPIVLSPNSANNVTLIAVDKAGNVQRSQRIQVFQDSTGPDVATFELETQCGLIPNTPTSCHLPSTQTTAETYFDSIVRASTNSQDVDSMWFLDPYGAKTLLIRIYPGAKIFVANPVSSKLWSLGNPTVQIAANDSLGNVNTQEFNIIVRDTIAPDAQRLSVEDRYGRVYGQQGSQGFQNLGPGRYYIYINATEPLTGTSANISWPNSTNPSAGIANAEPLSRTYDASEWLSYFDIPAGYTDLTSTISGSMAINLLDRHNLANELTRSYQMYLTSPQVPVQIPDYTADLGISTLNLVINPGSNKQSQYLGGISYVTNAHRISLQGLTLGMGAIYVIGADGMNYTSTITGNNFNVTLPLLGANLQEKENKVTIIGETGSGRRGIEISITKDLAPPQLIFLGVEKG